MTPINLAIDIHAKLRDSNPKCVVVFASADDVTLVCDDIKKITDILDDSMAYNPVENTISCDGATIKVALSV